jgi:hypothetical protein
MPADLTRDVAFARGVARDVAFARDVALASDVDSGCRSCNIAGLSCSIN